MEDNPLQIQVPLSDKDSTAYGAVGFTYKEKFHQPKTVVVDKLREVNPEAFNTDTSCPDTYTWTGYTGSHQSPYGPCPSVGTVWNIVQHLNDYHRWTRERIADWVEESGLNFEFPQPEALPKKPVEE